MKKNYKYRELYDIFTGSDEEKKMSADLLRRANLSLILVAIVYFTYPFISMISNALIIIGISLILLIPYCKSNKMIVDCANQKLN